MKSIPHTKSTVRFDQDVFRAITKLAEAKNMSFNAMLNFALKEYCLSIVQRDFPNAIHVSDLIGKRVSVAGYTAVLISRIEAARNGARELRIIGECGMCHSFDDFMAIKADALSSHVKQLIADDIEANGVHTFNSAGSDAAKAAREKYVNLGWIDREGFTFDDDGEQIPLSERTAFGFPASDSAVGADASADDQALSDLASIDRILGTAK